jgi:hypothetical protein
VIPAPGRPAGPTPPAPSGPDGPRPSTPADRVLPVPTFPPPRHRRDLRAAGARAWRRSWPWLVAVAAVVLVVAAELGLLRDRIQSDLARLRDAGGAPAPAATAPASTLLPLPAVAPATAGDVSAVRLRLLDPPCSPGSACTVVVGVDRRPGALAAPTTWTLLAADRCRGGLVPLTTGTTAAAPGAYGIATVVLPPGRALALVATTRDPSAASAALAIGTGPC